MSQSLLRIAADFDTQLATASSIGATTATLVSATDDDGNALPTGLYGLTIDAGNSSKEYIICTLTSTALTGILSVTRQGVTSSGFARTHRRGAKVTLTDWAILKRMLNNLDGTTGFDSASPLSYDGNPTFTADGQIITKKYADDLAIAGSPDASTTVKGISKLSSAPASPTEPIAVGTNDTRVPTQDENNALVGNNTDIAVGSGNKYVTQTGLQKSAEVYAASTTGNDTYVVTLSPVPTSLVNGMTIRFKPDTANTGAATLNVNSLGALAIVTGLSTPLATGDILANQVVEVVYNSTGTVWQLVNPASAVLTPVSTILNDVPNTLETNASWFTWIMPIPTMTTTTVAGWGLYQFAIVEAGKGGAYNSVGNSNNGGSIYTALTGTGSNDTFRFSDGKKWKAKFKAKVNNDAKIISLGLSANGTTSNIYQAETNTAQSQMRIVWNSSNIYLTNSNGTNYTANTASGITRTNWNLYELYFDGTNLYLYINGILKATNSTNLPTTTADVYFSIGGDTQSNNIYITPIIFSLEI